MIKQTIQLFFKALTIGILLNVGLAQVPRQAVNETVITPSVQQAPSSSNVDMFASNP